MNKERILHDTFLADWKSGILAPLLDRIKKDDTLYLALRDGSCNIYYRGGSLLRVTCKGAAHEFHFDKKYDNSHGHEHFKTLDLPVMVENAGAVQRWIAAIPWLKEFMDFWFKDHRKAEREFQQLVVRENNHSNISSDTEYFISDIEITDTNLNARFDLAGIKWKSKDRKDGTKVQAVLVEMKYGDDALGGTAGMTKHLADINNLLSDPARKKQLYETLSAQFAQQKELGLLEYNFGTTNAEVLLPAESKAEVIFLLANFNPRSKKLADILQSQEFCSQIRQDLYDLRFFTASAAGYGMHSSCMLPLDDFVSYLMKMKAQEK